MGTIVVGYVPKPEGQAALRRAAEEALLRDAKLIVVNSHRGGREFDHDDSIRSEGELEQIREQLTKAGVSHRPLPSITRARSAPSASTAAPGPTRKIRPRSTTTSTIASRPDRGSMARTPRNTRRSEDTRALDSMAPGRCRQSLRCHRRRQRLASAFLAARRVLGPERKCYAVKGRGRCLTWLRRTNSDG